MKRAITRDDLEAAVYGGAILGGGGGGFVEPGLRTARLALDAGAPQLWTVDEFDDDDLTTTVALVGAPAAPDPMITPANSLRALELLSKHLGDRLVAIHPNENGSETSVNGWFQSAVTGLPVLDFACNGRAHPSSVMGAMGLHLVEGYRSVQTWAGGHPHNYVQGLTEGSLDGAASIVRRASMEAGGWVGVARNPVTIGHARANGAVGAISRAIDLGHTYLNGGMDAAVEALGARIVAEGRVVHYSCVQREGLDIGKVVLDDTASTTLHFVNEYMVAEQGEDRLGSFPELIMTFNAEGVPVPSGHVREGEVMRVMIAPTSSMALAPTMFMPDLYQPLEEALGITFAPTLHA
ncbi:MAG: DUF917 family protein [Propioniciclava sp.]